MPPMLNRYNNSLIDLYVRTTDYLVHVVTMDFERCFLSFDAQNGENII